jgi:hypothetical protein
MSATEHETRPWSGEVVRHDRVGNRIIDRVAITKTGTVLRVYHERVIGTVGRDADGDWLAKSSTHGNAGFDTRAQALVWLVERDDMRRVAQ